MPTVLKPSGTWSGTPWWLGSGKRETARWRGPSPSVYDHHTAGLTDTLTELQHEYHDLIISTVHVHLDEHNCLETLIVRGSPWEAKQLADPVNIFKGDSSRQTDGNFHRQEPQVAGLPGFLY